MTATAEPMRGLKLQVYRTVRSEDCTNGGITAEANQVTLVGVMDQGGGEIVALPQGSRKWEPAPDAPAVVLVKRPGLGDYLRPLGSGSPRTWGWCGMGGNYADGDSRFTALLARGFYGAVPIHDRFE